MFPVVRHRLSLSGWNPDALTPVNNTVGNSYFCQFREQKPFPSLESKRKGSKAQLSRQSQFKQVKGRTKAWQRKIQFPDAEVMISGHGISVLDVEYQPFRTRHDRLRYPNIDRVRNRYTRPGSRQFRSTTSHPKATSWFNFDALRAQLGPAMAAKEAERKRGNVGHNSLRQRLVKSRLCPGTTRPTFCNESAGC